jgi:transposase-like protein
MDEGITSELRIEETSSKDLLERLVREGARNALQAALEEEVTLFLQRFAGFRDEGGHRRAVRNGYLPRRTILSGIGPLEVRQPRVDDRRLRDTEGGQRFSSAILPRFMRKTPSLEALILVLYLIDIG